MLSLTGVQFILAGLGSQLKALNIGHGIKRRRPGDLGLISHNLPVIHRINSCAEYIDGKFFGQGLPAPTSMSSAVELVMDCGCNIRNHACLFHTHGFNIDKAFDAVFERGLNRLRKLRIHQNLISDNYDCHIQDLTLVLYEIGRDDEDEEDPDTAEDSRVYLFDEEGERGDIVIHRV